MPAKQYPTIEPADVGSSLSSSSSSSSQSWNEKKLYISYHNIGDLIPVDSIKSQILDNFIANRVWFWQFTRRLSAFSHFYCESLLLSKITAWIHGTNVTSLDHTVEMIQTISKQDDIHEFRLTNRVCFAKL